MMMTNITMMMVVDGFNYLRTSWMLTIGSVHADDMKKGNPKNMKYYIVNLFIFYGINESSIAQTFALNRTDFSVLMASFNIKH